MDSQTDPKEQPGLSGPFEGAPPLFSTWGRLYGAVIAYLAAFIVFLYLFTEYFQILQ